jgi:hypothetical protein
MIMRSRSSTSLCRRQQQQQQQQQLDCCCCRCRRRRPDARTFLLGCLVVLLAQAPLVTGRNIQFWNNNNNNNNKHPSNATISTAIANITEEKNTDDDTVHSVANSKLQDGSNASFWNNESMSKQRHWNLWVIGRPTNKDINLVIMDASASAAVPASFSDTNTTDTDIVAKNETLRWRSSNSNSNDSSKDQPQTRPRKLYWWWQHQNTTSTITTTTKTTNEEDRTSPFHPTNSKEGTRKQEAAAVAVAVAAAAAAFGSTTIKSTTLHPHCPNFNAASAALQQQQDEDKSQTLGFWRLRKRRRRRRQTKNMDQAYRMAILSSLAYWELHKMPLPNNRTGFQVQSYQTGAAVPVLLHASDEKNETNLASMIGRAIEIQKCRIVTWFRQWFNWWRRNWVETTTTRTTTSTRILDRHPYSSMPTTSRDDLEEEEEVEITRPLPSEKQEKNTKKGKTTKTTTSTTTSTTTAERPLSCHARYWQKQAKKEYIQLQYQFYDWYEPTKLGNYHDTDLLVSTSHNGHTLILSFAGTASHADVVTNLQTFEPASHSGFLLHRGGGGGGGGGGGRRLRQNHNSTTTTTNSTNDNGNGNHQNRKKKKGSTRGALHRGFLNAYSRVERGSILRLCDNCTKNDKMILHRLNQEFGHCTRDSYLGIHNQDNASKDDTGEILSVLESSEFLSRTTDEEHDVVTDEINPVVAALEVKPIRKRGGCHARNKKLRTILQELVVDALEDGRTVHITGHSLGAAIGTLLALDIIVNFPDTPVSQLQLWTFGAPQFSDNEFLESAIEKAPRLEHFLDANHGKFHRFVTLSDSCQEDIVSTVTQQALAPQERDIRGLAARRVGGVRGSVVHLAKPHYLVTPEQYHSSATTTAATIEEEGSSGSNSTAKSSSSSSSSTRSAIAAHSTKNYIRGVSLQSSFHPLSTDLPGTLREWLGEVQVEDVSRSM